ncbi:hypothetical protein V6O07_00655 [Arthrospira platensis SPKY2]
MVTARQTSPNPSTEGAIQISYDHLVLLMPRNTIEELDFLSSQLQSTTHSCQINSARGVSTYKIDFRNVAIEEEGAAGWQWAIRNIPELRESKGLTGVIDIGGGNVNFSVFGGSNSLNYSQFSRLVTDYGVQSLLNMLVNDERFPALCHENGLKKIPSADYLQKTITDGSFCIGQSGHKFSYRSLFDDVALKWIDFILSTGIGHWRNGLTDLDYIDLAQILFLGGGSAIVGLMEQVSDDGENSMPVIVPGNSAEAKNYQLANALGVLHFPEYKDPSKSVLVVDCGNHALKIVARIKGRIYSYIGSSMSGTPSGSLLKMKDAESRRKFHSAPGEPETFGLSLFSGKVFEQYRSRKEEVSWILGDSVHFHSSLPRAAHRQGAEGKINLVPVAAIGSAYLIDQQMIGEQNESV